VAGRSRAPRRSAGIVEVLVVTRVQESFAASHTDGSIPVEFNLFCGVRRYVALGVRSWLGEAHKGSPNAT
jgi:hypothetical protein